MKIIFLLSFSFVFYKAYAQPTFQRFYGNARNERCQSAYQTSDGGYLLNGATTSFGTGDVDALTIKTDAQGNILWSKSCGTSGTEIPTFAIETYDNNILIIGSTESPAMPDAIMYKSDSAGNFLWAKSFGGVNNENAAKIIEQQDHGYVVMGNTESYGSGASDIYLMRTNENGDSLYTGIYGTADNEMGKSISPTNDGGFIVCGKSSSFISGALVFQAILMRLNSSGNLLWTKLYGDTLFQEAQSVVETSDGGFIVCGSRDFTSHGDYDILLFKTDSTGNIQWSKTYGGNKGEGSYMVNLNEDGTYVLSGYTNSMGSGHRGDDSTNVFLMKTTAFGDTIWTRTYGDTLQEEAFLSAKTADGGFILSGFSDYHNSDSSQMLIIKTDSLGFSGCYDYTSHPVIVTDLLSQFSVNYIQTAGMVMNPIVLTSTSQIITDSTNCLLLSVNEKTLPNLFSIYPNPVTDKLYVKSNLLKSYKNNLSGRTEINVYNMLGEKIFISTIFNNDVFEINVESLKSGIYVLEILIDNQRSVQKFVR